MSCYHGVGRFFYRSAWNCTASVCVCRCEICNGMMACVCECVCVSDGVYKCGCGDDVRMEKRQATKNTGLETV